MLIETTYQAFISFFHQTGIIQENPELEGIRKHVFFAPIRSSKYPYRCTADYSSAIAIELRRGAPPDIRDFLRIKFKNGTRTSFQDVHVFRHHADIPLTEFIYRAEVLSAVIYRFGLLPNCCLECCHL